MERGQGDRVREFHIQEHSQAQGQDGNDKVHQNEDDDEDTKCNAAFQSNLPLKKRHPTCARCRNHGLIFNLKGHKRVCQYRSCQCNRCSLVVQRRQVMARQLALNREQQKERQRQKILEHFDDLPESQRFCHDWGSPDLNSSPTSEVPTENPINSPEVNQECFTSASAPWNPSQSYTEPISAPNDNNRQTWTYGRSYSPISASATLSMSMQGGYTTMKQQALRSVDTTPVPMPYPIGDLSSFGINSSAEPSSQYCINMFTNPSAMSAYQVDPPSFQTPFETQYFLDSVPSISDVDETIQIPPAVNTPVTSILPSTSLACATSTYPSTWRSSRPNPGRITIPPLDQSQEYIYTQSSIPYCFPPASSGTHSSEFTFSGNPTPSSGTPYSMPYFNYPSPTLPTQTNPVLSFPQTSNPPDSTLNFVFPCNYSETTTSSQPAYFSTEVNAFTSSSRDLPAYNDFKEDEIDVCSPYQCGLGGAQIMP